MRLNVSKWFEEAVPARKRVVTLLIVVPAMLGVGLGEHHELDVIGIASEGLERVHQVVDFVVGTRVERGRRSCRA